MIPITIEMDRELVGWWMHQGERWVWIAVFKRPPHRRKRHAKNRYRRWPR